MQSYDTIFFFIHDGFYCAHTGAGIHNFRILRTLRDIFPFSRIVVCPIYTNSKNLDRQKEWYEKALAIVKRDALEVIPIHNGTEGMDRYGGVGEWHRTSVYASNVILNRFSSDDKALCISIDTPFIGLIPQLGGKPNITHLHIPQSTGLLHEPNNAARLRLETNSLQNLSNNTFIGAIGDFMFNHLSDRYDVSSERILIIHNGCLQEDQKALEPAVNRFLNEKWNIGRDNRYIIAAYGRSIHYKGFHLLVESMKTLDSNKYRLLINATTDNEISKAYSQSLLSIAKEMGVDLTLYTDFDPNFPAFIRRQSLCLAIVIPSLAEPFGLIPGEIMSDPRSKSIVVSSDIDGLGPQISNREDGFLFSPTEPHELEQILKMLPTLSTPDKEHILRNGRQKALLKFDLKKNLLNGIKSMKIKNEK